jgi:hypothetical protein
MKLPAKVSKAFDICSDLCSEASPNQYTDPKSTWARRRSVKNMNAKQAKQFAIAAFEIYEHYGKEVYHPKK